MIVSSKENMAPSPKDHFDLSKICSESFSAQKGASLTWRVFLACLITNSSTGFHASAHATSTRSIIAIFSTNSQSNGLKHGRNRD